MSGQSDISSHAVQDISGKKNKVARKVLANTFPRPVVEK